MFQEVIDSREKKRLLGMLVHEQRLRQGGYKRIAGIDEAGRGALAGPVVVAACILPEGLPGGLMVPRLNDSKKLSPALRASLFEQLTSHPDVIYATAIVGPDEVDRINVLQATLAGMRAAAAALPLVPDYLLIDGCGEPFEVPHAFLVKGDQLSLSIAAASVLAKETRDRLMRLTHHSQWPNYRFDQHKGYGTAQHLALLMQHGPCPIHRRSFAPVRAVRDKTTR